MAFERNKPKLREFVLTTKVPREVICTILGIPSPPHQANDTCQFWLESQNLAEGDKFFCYLGVIQTNWRFGRKGLSIFPTFSINLLARFAGQLLTWSPSYWPAEMEALLESRSSRSAWAMSWDRCQKENSLCYHLGIQQRIKLTPSIFKLKKLTHITCTYISTECALIKSSVPPPSFVPFLMASTH